MEGAIRSAKHHGRDWVIKCYKLDHYQGNSRRKKNSLLKSEFPMISLRKN